MRTNNPFVKGLAKWRAKKASADARSRYYGAVHCCRQLSLLDNSFAFEIRQKGVFGSPDICQIRRPEYITISEYDDCVVIKDGKVYELKKEAI